MDIQVLTLRDAAGQSVDFVLIDGNLIYNGKSYAILALREDFDLMMQQQRVGGIPSLPVRVFAHTSEGVLSEVPDSLQSEIIAYRISLHEAHPKKVPPVMLPSKSRYSH